MKKRVPQQNLLNSRNLNVNGYRSVMANYEESPQFLPPLMNNNNGSFIRPNSNFPYSSQMDHYDHPMSHAVSESRMLGRKMMLAHHGSGNNQLDSSNNYHS
jgi:hypothetical protein